MNEPIPLDHPLRTYLATSLREILDRKLGGPEDDVEQYLTDLLTNFLHRDGLYAIRDADGLPVTTVAEMVEEGDIRLKADSFKREREVHRHIGDYLLFWSGFFPEHLGRLRAPGSPDAFLDPIAQGRMSYYVASSFKHPPYTEESKTLAKLSERFEAYRFGLNVIRQQLPGIPS